jgi:hypothetical protein
MRSLSTALCTAAALALVAGCSGSISQTTPSDSSTMARAQSRHSHGHSKPQWAFPANLINNKGATGPRFRQVLASIAKPTTSQPTRGLYVNQFYGDEIGAYQDKNTANNPPFCYVPTGATYVNGIGVDRKGNLITPMAESYSGYPEVVVWQGPNMCGAEVGQVTDPYGQPSDAAAFDAATGTMVIANIFDISSSPGSVSLCTLSGGCTVNLTNPAMYKVAGVALDTHGNCWASAEDTSGAATLTYFAGCAGAGQQATGFMNTDYGSLEFDRNGNLVSVDKSGVQLWVYSGCNPACTLVGGPFPLEGLSVFGTLNHQSMTFAAGDQENGDVDVYAYTPTSLTYLYSFSNGLSASAMIEGVAFNPAARP